MPAELTRVGTTSLSVAVEVWSERPQGGRGALLKVATASLTAVLNYRSSPELPEVLPDYTDFRQLIFCLGAHKFGDLFE